MRVGTGEDHIHAAHVVTKDQLSYETGLAHLFSEAKYLSALASHFGEEIDEYELFNTYFSTGVRLYAHIENDILPPSSRLNAADDDHHPYFTSTLS